MISVRSNGFESLHASATPAKHNWTNGERECWKTIPHRNIRPTALEPARTHTHTGRRQYGANGNFFSIDSRACPRHEHPNRKTYECSNSPSFSCIRIVRRFASYNFTLVSRRHAQSIAAFLATFRLSLRSLHQRTKPIWPTEYICRANCNYTAFVHSSISLRSIIHIYFLWEISVRPCIRDSRARLW